jgi:hypothetical protein
MLDLYLISILIVALIILVTWEEFDEDHCTRLGGNNIWIVTYLIFAPITIILFIIFASYKSEEET